MSGPVSLSALDEFFAGPDDLPIEFAFFYERLPAAEVLAEGLARTLPAFPRLVEGVPLLDIAGVEEPPEDKISRAVLFDSVRPGSGPPRCRLKISRFTSGGGCLGASMSHGLGDGGSLVLFLSAWARTVRGQAPVLPAASEPEFPPAPSLDKSLPLEAQLRRAGFGLRVPPTPRVREDYRWDIRRFAREEVETLLRDARVSRPQVTAGDVLAALLWRHYRRQPERRPRAEPELGTVFDFRRVPRLLPASYFGNAGLPLRVPLSPEEAATLPVPALAARIRARLQSASAEDFLRSHALLEEVRRTWGSEGVDLVGFSTESHGLLVNNISRFDLSLLDFGTGAPHAFDVITPIPRVCFIISRGDSLEAHTALPGT